MERGWEPIVKFLKRVGLHLGVASSEGELTPPFIQRALASGIQGHSMWLHVSSEVKEEKA